MPVTPVQNSVFVSKKPKFNSVSATGYGALGFGTLSVITAANKKIKTHKYLAYAAGALAFVHTGIILGRRMMKNSSGKNNG